MNNELSSIFYDAIRDHSTGQEDLEKLLKNFPFCQSFYIINASRQKGTPGFKAALQKAALYAPQRNILYELINDPDSLRVKNTEETYPESHDLYTETEPETAQQENLSDTENEWDLLDDSESELTGEYSAETGSRVSEAEIPETEVPEAGIPEENPRQQNSIFDNIASSDYFVFNNSAADPLLSTPTEDQTASSGEAAEPAGGNAAEYTTISKYDDDKMPYTFLWWLQKTRKEHAGTYQPYVTSKPITATGKVKKNFTDTLNQQIIENIFQSQIPVKEDKNTSAKIISKHKEEELIEKFIQEDPQIKPPLAEKIDTENKARKSSEDNFDMVSETLAYIYIDQMLYHKAIDTYKKLSLKFPEKSTYFAAQIVELEKKIS